MKRWLLFFALIVCLSAYTFSLLYITEEDTQLKKIFENLVSNTQLDNEDKKLMLNVIVTDEPSESGYAIDIVGKISAFCLISEKVVDHINTGIDTPCISTQLNKIKKTKIRLSKSKLNTDKNKNQEILIGDMLIVTGILEIYKTRSVIANLIPVSTPIKNNLSTTTTKIDFQQKDKNKNIFSTIDIKKIIEIKKTDQYSFKRLLISVRKSIELTISHALPHPESNLAAGLIISGKDSLPKEILEEFKRVGLIHIVVLSGSNVSIISQALFKVLGFTPRFIQVSLGIFLMSCFALMTGASPPVVRSVLMSSLPLLYSPIVSLIEKKKLNINTGHGIDSNQNNKLDDVQIKKVQTNASLCVLIAVAFIMSIYNPLLPLFDMSFQLSFLANLGLIVLSNPITNRLSFIPQTFGLRDIVGSSLATQVYIAPLLLHMSGNLSAVFLIANIIVLPLLPLVMFLIFLIPLSSFIFPMLVGVIGEVSYFLLRFILKFTHWLSTFPLATVEFSTFNTHIVPVIYAFLFIFTAIYLSFPHTCE